jgi:hypothetical protein
MTEKAIVVVFAFAGAAAQSVRRAQNASSLCTVRLTSEQYIVCSLEALLMHKRHCLVRECYNHSRAHHFNAAVT